MDEKLFSILFEEIRLLRKEVIELKSLLGKEQAQTALKPAVPGLDGGITAVLQDLMVPAHIKGYSMSREAIKMVCQDSSLLGCFTTIIYPEIAKMYDSTPNRVERAIRHAIEVSWGKSRTHPFYARFKHKNPTNSEFIALIVDKFILEEKSKLEGVI